MRTGFRTTAWLLLGSWLASMGAEFLAKSQAWGHGAGLFPAEAPPHGFSNPSPGVEGTMQRIEEFVVSVGRLESRRWTVGHPVFQAGAPGTFDDVAVKDPSFVRYKGRYHIFYTSKQQLGKRGYRTALGYVSAATWDELSRAKRHDLAEVLGIDLIAPQIFYFQPHQLWYLIAHTKVVGSRELVPMYTTNPNVANPSGWCLPQPLKTGRTREEFRIDFWVICDEEHAHLFYSNQRGEVLRIACPIDTFPHGFASAHEQVAIGPLRGETEAGTWRLFEAQHVYRVKNIQRYFMLAECAYVRRAPPGSHWLDSTNRFLIGFTADRLEGPWSRLEGDAQTHWATAEDLQTEEGQRPSYSLVSHPEIVRSGYDQRLEIDDLDAVEMLFQTFDASKIREDYQYDELPWQWAVMRNH